MIKDHAINSCFCIKFFSFLGQESSTWALHIGIDFSLAVTAERRGWEEAVLVRRGRAEIRGRFWGDCYCMLRTLPPRCGRGHRQPDQALATLHRPLPQLRHR